MRSLSQRYLRYLLPMPDEVPGRVTVPSTPARPGTAGGSAPAAGRRQLAAGSAGGVAGARSVPQFYETIGFPPWPSDRKTLMPQTDDSLQPRLRAWAADAGCRLCVLFGSRAGAAEAVPGDVDVALLFSDLPEPRRRLEMISEVQSLCGRAPADVVFLHLRTDPVLRFEIFRRGIPIFEVEEGLFVDEKVRALMLYEDALPFRRRLRERLRRDAGARAGNVQSGARAEDPAEDSDVA